MKNFLRTLTLSAMLCGTLSAKATATTTTTEEWQLELGESRTLQVGEEFYVLSVESVNDSRCPANAFCVWAGQAVVSLKVDNFRTTESEFYDLTLAGAPQLNENEIAVLKLAGSTLRLIEVSPYPGLENVGETIEQTVTIEITKKETDCRSTVPQFCTLEYAPVTCEFMGATIFGSNRCDANRQAEMLACRAGLPVETGSLSCSAVGS